MTSPPTDLSGSRPLTMGDVERVIDRHRQAFVMHPFMVRLEGEGTIEQFRRMLPRHAFFTLVFQDVLRLARERCSDPQIQKIASTHELEDKGHDQWYLDDLKRLDIPLDVRWMFSADHALARDVGYRLVSEILTVSDDRSRLSVVLSLEAIAREFFIRVSRFVEHMAHSDGLQYFGARHLAVEKSHEVFSDDGKGQLARINVPSHAVQELLVAIDRTFEAMSLLADDLEAAMRSVE